jgi:hypothetical protein
MELDEFVHNSLVQIMRGIKSAQKEWGAEISGDGVVNPAWDGPEDFRNRTQDVRFDVAVTAASKTEGGGSSGIKVVALVDISGKANHSVENNTVSRICFSIPILPPTITVKK